MHDIDRTQLEYGSGEFESESEQLGYEDEAGSYEGIFGESSLQEAPIDEAELTELASDLLGVTSERELDHFLGSLIHRVSGAVGKIVPSNIRQALGGYLKAAAKKALPIVGAAVGTALGGPAGGAIGSKLASTAGGMFGLELEGLSDEDQEFEVAKAFTRFASQAVQNAAGAAPIYAPQASARDAVIAAAGQYAPGLLGETQRALGRRSAGGPGGTAPGAPHTDHTRMDATHRATGRPSQGIRPPGVHGPLASAGVPPETAGEHLHRGTWVRHGRKIVLFGV